MRYEEIFRNTKNWYLSQSNCASESLINFAVMHAGDTMLDAGCATGDYIQRLGDLGYHCVGVDINSEYINKAKQKGLDAHVMDLKHLEMLLLIENDQVTIYFQQTKHLYRLPPVG